MTLECRDQRRKIFDGFQAVKVVRAFAEFNASGAKLLETTVVAQSDAAPIIALKEKEGAIEMKSRYRQQAFCALPDSATKIHRLSTMHRFQTSVRPLKIPKLL
jgi:hypothetical protein